MTHYLNHPGHRTLLDGSILRLDLELGLYVATFYRSDLSIRCCRRGDLDEMTAVIDAWVAAFYQTFGETA